MIKTDKNLEKFENPGMHNQMYIVWDKAKGCFISYNKRKVLDFTSTIFVTNIGHGNKRLSKDLIKSINTPIIHSYNYINKNRIKYIKLLKDFCGSDFEKFHLLSTGSEATEAALKLMRLYGTKRKKRRNGVITLKGNWHGRTMGAQLLCSDKNQKKWIGFNDPNIFHLDFPYPWIVKGKKQDKFFYDSLDKIKKKINFKKDVCGIMLEAFQGWGAIFYSKEYIKAIKKFCIKNDILLAFDEQQSGFGRTGKKFAYQHYGVKPDLICCGKGMGSGYPLSGVFAKSKILNLAQPGTFSSTHSANPLACAAGIATIKEINSKKLIERAKINGKYFQNELNKIKDLYPNFVSSIQGKGLIAAIIFKKKIKLKDKIIFGSKFADMICFGALKSNLLLVRTGRESIKMGPPLIINKKLIKQGIKIISSEIEKILK